MTFCPDWIYDAAMARTAEEFLSSDLPLQAVAKKYSTGLSEKYAEIRSVSWMVSESLTSSLARQDSMKLSNRVLVSLKLETAVSIAVNRLV
jgi:hypothetical protein